MYNTAFPFKVVLYSYFSTVETKKYKIKQTSNCTICHDYRSLEDTGAKTSHY